jgi:hypothetical protein
MEPAASLAPPIPPTTLLQQVQRLRELLDGLVPLLSLGLPPRFRELARNVNLALERPDSLESPDNQLDFVEEVVEALWAEPFPDLLDEGGPSGSLAERTLSQSRLEASWEQLDGLSQHLCTDVESWHRRRALAAHRSHRRWSEIPSLSTGEEGSVHSLSTGCQQVQSQHVGS